MARNRLQHGSALAQKLTLDTHYDYRQQTPGNNNDRPFSNRIRREGQFTFMSAPQEKKRKAGGSPGGAQRKRVAEQDLDVPTLGQVAEEARFAPLHELLNPVKDTPVNELGQDLRAWLKGEARKIALLPLALAFFGACDARAEEAAHKRVHVASEEHSPGKQQRWLFFSLSFLRLSLSPLCALAPLAWARCHPWCEEGSVSVSLSDAPWTRLSQFVFISLTRSSVLPMDRDERARLLLDAIKRVKGLSLIHI